MTVRRLELLSALLLSKLMDSISLALQPSRLQLEDPVCYTDSKVALCWIRGRDQEWKQFVENRVNSIRASVPPERWRHCPGKENPADIPSRGMSAPELSHNPTWLQGPHWLSDTGDLPGAETPTAVPDECKQEMKSRLMAHTLLTNRDNEPGIHQLINCEDYVDYYESQLQ